MLASNDEPYDVFSASTAAFYGKTELQGATFVQFSRNGATYFGLQTKTHEQAKQAVEIGKGAKLHPRLTCLDALGNIPESRMAAVQTAKTSGTQSGIRTASASSTKPTAPVPTTTRSTPRAP
jgi:hypothetical protein